MRKTLATNKAPLLALQKAAAYTQADRNDAANLLKTVPRFDRIAVTLSASKLTDIVHRLDAEGSIHATRIGKALGSQGLRTHAGTNIVHKGGTLHSEDGPTLEFSMSKHLYCPTLNCANPNGDKTKSLQRNWNHREFSERLTYGRTTPHDQIPVDLQHFFHAPTMPIPPGPSVPALPPILTPPGPIIPPPSVLEPDDASKSNPQASKPIRATGMYATDATNSLWTLNQPDGTQLIMTTPKMQLHCATHEIASHNWASQNQ